MIRLFRKIILLIFFPIFIFAQQEDIKFEHISLKDGLSQSTIRCIFQDSKGFMWFGTKDGLSRYDGYDFRIYKHEPDNPASMIANPVFYIFEDKLDRLWIATESRLDLFGRSRN